MRHLFLSTNSRLEDRRVGFGCLQQFPKGCFICSIEIGGGGNGLGGTVCGGSGFGCVVFVVL